VARGAKRAAVEAGPVEVPWELPDGWRWERLQDVAEVNPRTELNLSGDEPVTFVPMAAVGEETGLIDISQTRSAADVAKGFTRFREGDVLFAKITPCMENGKIAEVPALKSAVGAGSTEFHVIRSSAFCRGFLLHYLLQLTVRQQAERNMSGSAGQKRVATDYLRLLPVPVPPPDTQRRIVARIDELFAEIDEGEAALRAARAGQEAYRHAVLFAATTGKLASARDRKSRLTGTELLTSLVERRRSKWAESGHRKTYKEPCGADPDGLPALPPHWCWASLDQLCTVITSGSRAWAPYYNRGTATFIMAQNVRAGRYDSSFRQFVDPPEDDPERRRTQVRRNDLLLTIVGANTGDLCQVRFEPQEHYVCQSVALLRPVDPDLGAVAELFLASRFGRALQMGRLIYGAGRPHLSFDQIKSLAVPIPPPEEIPEVLQAARSMLGDQQTPMLDGVAPATLRQSILAAAFRGDLVA
jgi:type I restriction enzyme, S subunit